MTENSRRLRLDVTAEGAMFAPDEQFRPAPGERIAVWFGGKFTPRQIRRIVELGDGWMPYGGHPMTVPEKAAAISVLRDRFVSAGRDPASLDVCDALAVVDGSIQRSFEQLPALAAAGVTVIRVHLRRYAQSPEDVLPVLEEVVRQFEPYCTL